MTVSEKYDAGFLAELVVGLEELATKAGLTEAGHYLHMAAAEMAGAAAAAREARSTRRTDGTNRTDGSTRRTDYPDGYQPGRRRSLDAAWEIMDFIKQGAIPEDVRFWLAGAIAGRLERERELTLRYGSGRQETRKGDAEG